MPLTPQQLNELIDRRNPSGLDGAAANKRLIEILHALADASGGSSSQVNSDWNSTSGVSQILNKPDLAKIATSGSWNDLINKPVFNAGFVGLGNVANVLQEPYLGIPLVDGYVLGSTSAGVRSWIPIPSSPVLSVFGRTGVILAQSGDYSFAQISAKPTTLSGYGIMDGQPLNPKLTAFSALANASGWLHNNGSGVFSYSTPTYTDVGADPAGAAASITLAGLGGVPTSRTVNSHPLSADVVVSASDVGLGSVLNVAQEPALGNPASNGYVLSSTTAGVRSWIAIPSAPVSSVFGRVGVVTAQSNDYTFAQIGSTPTTLGGYGITDAVPNTRTVNGHALSADVTVTKSDVGLGSVENTALSTWAGSSNLTTLGTITTGVWNGSAIADAYISSAANWNSKEPAIAAGTTAQYWRGDKTFQTLDKIAVGLGNVENTALSTWVGSTNLVTLGTITTGKWKASIIDVVNGGTGLSQAPYPIESDNIASGISSSTYDSFGITLKCNSGKMIVVYRSATSHVSAGDYGVIKSSFSIDRGRTWSSPTTIGSLANYDCRNVGGGTTPTGRLVVFYGRLNPDINPWNDWLDFGYIYSDDEGSTWSAYTTLNRDGMQFISHYGSMIEIGDGKLMQTWYGDDGTNYRAYVVFSSDNGATWSGNVVVATSTTDRYSEACMVYLGGKSIVGLVRVDNQNYWKQVKSEDNGSTWTNQGNITFDTFTITTPPWLSVYQDVDGRLTVDCFWYNRDTFNLNRISGRSLLSGVSGWDINTIQILATGSQYDSGYPSVVRDGPYYFGWWYQRTGAGLGQITFFQSNNVIYIPSRISINGGKLVSSDGLAVGSGVRVTRTGADGFFNFERLGSIVDGDDLGSFGGVGLNSSSIRKQYGGVFFTAFDTDGVGQIDLRTYDFSIGGGLNSAFKIVSRTAYLPGYTTQGIMSIGASGLLESGRTDLSPIFGVAESRKVDAVISGVSEALIISHSGGASSTNDIGAAISFKNFSGVYSSYQLVAQIAGITENATSLTGAISISVNNASAVLTERMRIAANGRVGIGTSIPGATLDVATVDNPGRVARLSSNGGFGTALEFINTATNGRSYSLGSNFVVGAGEFSIFDDTSGVERFRIKSNGSLLLLSIVRATSSSGLASGEVWCDTSDGNRLKIV